ncbi:MAG: sugar phosphate nucleotidyltransferase [Candidatus Omnitrophica bacterium]|jgi:NDP-sugar pyrophosphorylase family protein|nr:sugar phosphate nucleotidyltransferase [Candidatus Omnitrophota bacterium]
MKNIDVVILCGGLGRRLRPAVSDRPKPMAQVNNKPFLDILIQYLAGFGLKRFILCSGYMGDAIRKHYKRIPKSLEIVLSQEKKPLGTGGAIKNAQSLILSSSFLVLNGDSFCRVNFSDFYKFHLKKKALLSIVLSRPKDDQNSGVVILDHRERIVKFNEKVKPLKGSFCSVGIYLMGKEIFQFMGENKIFSLEYDLFPALAGKNCYGYYCKKDFVDIGTPQNLMKASNFLKHE